MWERLLVGWGENAYFLSPQEELDFCQISSVHKLFFYLLLQLFTLLSPLFWHYTSIIDHEINWNQRTKIMLHVFVQWHCDLFEVNSLMYIVYSACTGQNLMANSRKTLWSQQQEHWSLAPILTIAFISLFINHSRMFFAVVFQSSIHKKGISLVLAILTWTVIPFVIILCVYT